MKKISAFTLIICGSSALYGPVLCGEEVEEGSNMVKKNGGDKDAPKADKTGTKKSESPPSLKKPSTTQASKPQSTSQPSRTSKDTADVSIPDFKLEIHEIKTKLPYAIWYIPSDLPIVLICIDFKDAGSKNTSRDHPSLPYFISPMLAKGAGKYNHLKYLKRLYDNGANLNFCVGIDHAGCTLWAPADSYEDPLELAVLAMTSPRLPKDELKKLKKCALIDIEESQKVPRTCLQDAMSKLFYPIDHPYRSCSDEDKTDVSTIERNDIRNFLKFWSQSNAYVTILGPWSRQSEIAAKVEEQLLKLPVSGKPTVEGPFQLNPILKNIDVYFNVPQTLIVAKALGFNKKDLDDYAIKLAFWVFAQSSMSSMMFKQIREKLGLSYFCGGQPVRRELECFLQFAMGTQTETVNQAKEALIALLKQTIQRGMTREQFDTGKQELVGGCVVRLDSSEHVVSYIGRLRLDGYSRDDVILHSAKIAAVTYEQANNALKGLCSRLCENGQLVFGTVGNGASNA
ncbi:MAG: insulinase family protein [Holosporales bacterium]|jgi:zinc protease|nr:insulinase family protein [Holosporales bacterium]